MYNFLFIIYINNIPDFANTFWSSAFSSTAFIHTLKVPVQMQNQKFLIFIVCLNSFVRKLYVHPFLPQNVIYQFLPVCSIVGVYMDTPDHMYAQTSCSREVLQKQTDQNVQGQTEISLKCLKNLCEFLSWTKHYQPSYIDKQCDLVTHKVYTGRSCS